MVTSSSRPPQGEASGHCRESAHPSRAAPLSVGPQAVVARGVAPQMSRASRRAYQGHAGRRPSVVVLPEGGRVKPAQGRNACDSAPNRHSRLRIGRVRMHRRDAPGEVDHQECNVGHGHEQNEKSCTRGDPCTRVEQQQEDAYSGNVYRRECERGVERVSYVALQTRLESGAGVAQDPAYQGSGDMRDNSHKRYREGDCSGQLRHADRPKPREHWRRVVSQALGC